MGQVSTTAIASLIFAHLCLCDESPRGCPAGPSSGDQYRLVTAIPAGCDPSNCDYYLGIRTNDEDPEFLDFMMVGKAQGWIAIGFSLKQEMPDADVLACAVNPDTSQVVIMDTYNVPDDHNNIPDTIQDVCPHSANFTGGRISCVFSRAINTGDPQDKDLNGNYYEQFAAVDNPAVISGGSVSLSKHKQQTPSISKEMVNPAKDSTPLDIALLPSSSSSSVSCPSGPSSGAQYRLVTAIPAGCDLSNCDYYLGIRTNDEDPEFLDFMMVGKAQGWIAIGFSLKQEMPDADVLACAVNPDTSQVVVMDTYNVPDDHNNIPDTIQDVCPHSANFTGGRISCVFSRAINTGDPQDKDLNGDYYEQFAAVDNPAVISGGNVSLSEHTHQTPSISKEMVNPAKDSTPLDIALLPSSSSSSSVSCPSGPSSGAQYRLVTAIPAGCDPSNCDYYLGIRTNDEDPEFLDFMMVGKAQGWIAIGFSLKQEMPDADVLACAVNPDTSQVVVMDTYNVPDDHNNIPDTIQNVCPHSANFTGGRISCVFSRAINTGDPQDKDLNGDYYEQFAAVNNPAVISGGSVSLSKHKHQTPSISKEMVNPAKDSTPLDIALLPSSSSSSVSCPSGPSSGVQYRLVTAIPAGCDLSNCDYYWGIRTNDEDPEFLDFMMVGKAQGWIAIGFSLKQEMPDADVLACAVNPDTSQVVVMDTYNVPDDHNNIPDTIQNVCPHSANFTGGRISCVFSRAINTGDPQDKDLNGDYYEQFAAVDNPAVISGGSVSLSKHKHQTPSISKEMVNPAKDSTPLDIALLPSSSSSSSVSCPSGPSSGAQYRLVTAIPAGCDPSNCDYYLGIRTNDEDPEFLDFMMVGKAQGWIAIGFSLKQEMPDADVLACAVNPDTSQVVVMDTYNVPDDHNNIPDTIQNVCPHSANFTGGRISCVFSRAINTGDPQDKDLNGDYYEQFAAVDNPAVISGGSMSLSKHKHQTPSISKEMVNPAKDSTPLDIALLPSSSSSSSSVSCPSGPSSGAQYRLVTAIPAGCDLSNCDYYLGIRTNDEDPEFLDFMMVGKAQGWIAIGFSLKQEMPDADVLACAVNPDTSQVVVMDTYNVPDDHNNIPDTIQNVCPHSANFTGGRISCVFSRAINTGDPQDKDLNGDYYEQFAAVDNPAVISGGSVSLSKHKHQTPSISKEMVNPAKDSTPLDIALLPSSSSSVSCPSGPSPGAQYRLVTAIPAGCDPSNCDYYLGIRTNDEDPEFLDFMMVGKAQGWIAIGFSLKQEMPDADVLACAVNPDTSQVVIMDTYNVPDDHNNIPDTIQNVCPHSANFTGGRISCVFSRAINTGDPQDKDLNGDYYEQFAAVDNPAVISGGSVSLSKHKHQTPSISKEMVNPAKDSTPLEIALLPSSSSSSSVSCPSGPSSGAQYRLVTAIPAGCDPSNCDYYLGIRTNDEDPEFLDFMMVGKAQGWIAIGFSLKQEMPDAEVLACAVNPDTSQVVVMDTYNSGYNNIRDPMQSLCSHSAGTSNGIISCVFSRAINTGDPQDKDLNGDYYEQFAAVDNPAAIVSGNVTLTYHGSQTPLISKSTVNPATTNGSVSSSSPLRVILTRVHGILMVVAWPVLAVTGIFFAAWMKPVLRNGWWFQIHRSLMMSSVFVSSAALVLVFVANKDNPTPGLIELCNRPKAIAHFGIGCTVMVLQIINPVVALCRCAPGTPRRWIFNLLHGTSIGLTVLLLALGNTGIGASLFEDTISKAPAGNHTILWPLIAVVTFITTLLIVLIIAVNRPGSAHSIFHLLAKDKEEEKLLIGEEEAVGYKPGIVKKTTLIENSIVRWMGLAFLLAVMLPLLTYVAVLIALK